MYTHTHTVCISPEILKTTHIQYIHWYNPYTVPFAQLYQIDLEQKEKKTEQKRHEEIIYKYNNIVKVKV